MQPFVLDMLECPACRGELAWRVSERWRGRVEEADGSCGACGATYAVRDGIGLLLTPEERLSSPPAVGGWAAYLAEHPEVERQLMGAPLADLNPADQFYRALVLEERGEFAQADEAAALARRGLYTSEYLARWDSQIRWLIQHLCTSDGPLVDLASGRCYLVEAISRELTRPVVASDLDSSILRRDRRRLEFLGLYDRVSLLAFDARRTPFRSSLVETMTTNLGLPNIADAGNVLAEIRRVVVGEFIAISHFYPEDDETNLAGC